MSISTHPRGFLFSIVNFYRTLVPEKTRNRIGAYLVPVLMVFCRGKVDTGTYTVFLNVFDREGREIFFKHFETGSWLLEPRETKIFKESIQLNPECKIIDLGANYGAYTLEAASLASVESASLIIAVEPNPKVFKFLTKSVSYNQFNKVMLVNAAVTDTVEKRLYLAYTTKSGLGYISSGSSNRSLRVQVAGTTLDKILDEQDISNNGKFILKMDVEGAEPAALRGMAGTLAQSVGFQIFLEFNPSALERQGERPVEFLQSLSDLKPEAFLDLSDTSQSLCNICDYEILLKRVHKMENQSTNLFLSKGLRLPKSLEFSSHDSTPAIESRNTFE